MKLSERISEDIKAAMRAKDKTRLEALRAAKTAFTLAKTQEGASDELGDDAELKIVQKLVKQRKDAAVIYRKQARADLYELEMAEAGVLEEYLPEKLDSDALRSYLRQLIKNTGASGMKDMGKVMGTATRELAGKAEGKEISAIVRELLN